MMSMASSESVGDACAPNATPSQMNDFSKQLTLN